MKKLILILSLFVLPVSARALTNRWCLCDIADTNKFASGATMELGRHVKVEMTRTIYINTTIDSGTTNADVTATGLIWCDTATNSINLHGFSGGVGGQEVRVVKTSSANNLVIKDQSSDGTQKIVTPDGGDITFGSWGGANIVFNASSSLWYVVSYSKQ